MKKVNGIKLTTYHLFDDWYIEIAETKDEFHSWLHEGLFGDRRFIVGMPKKQIDGIITLPHFYELVTYQIYYDMERYREEIDAIEDYYEKKFDEE